MPDVPVSQILSEKFDITAQPGQKVICPFCGKQTFSIKKDDTIGKCFHPNCSRYVTAAQFADRYQNSLYNILEALFYDCHKALLDLPKAHYDNHAWDYLTKERQIHPQVIQDAMLGVIPAGGIDLEARFKPLIDELEGIVKSQAERTTTAEGKSQKKRGRSKQSSSPDASNYLQFISETVEKLASCVDGHAGWLMFFYTDAAHRIVSIKFRKPYSKQILWFKPFKTVWGVFGQMFRPTSNHEPFDQCLFCEGEFNVLQMQSLVIRHAETQGIEPNYQACFAFGGATGPDFRTIERIARQPCLALDNDTAGLAVLDRMRAELLVRISAFTTPKPDSDLDSFIREFGGDHLAAWGAVVKLLAQRKPYYRIVRQIKINNRQLRDISNDAVEALLDKNDPPCIFVRSSNLTRVRQDENGRPQIDVLSEPQLRGRLTRVTDFYLDMGEELKSVSPPKDVVKDILALGTWEFPPLAAITEMPVLRPDGSVLVQSGYDPVTNLYYFPVRDLVIPKIPQNPTAGELKDAINLILEAIGEFPYLNESHRANAAGLLITPVIRPAINSEVPLALLDAPTPGTGKSLLSEVVSIISTGRNTGMMSAVENDEEWRKQITATLMMGSTIIIIDNVEHPLSAPSLARALTTPIWKDRILGRSEMVVLAQRATWIATGNNIQLRGDLPRRCYPIRLDARVAQPWKRTGFKHPNLVQWVTQNRGRLLAALLTMARAWFAAGRPPADVPTMGSFAEWAETVGGILAFAGISGFLRNMEEFYEKADEEARQWEHFLRVWKELAKPPLTSAQLAQLIEDDDALNEALPDVILEARSRAKSNGKGFNKSLGRALAQKEDRQYGEEGIYVTSVGEYQGAIVWQVLTAS